MYQLHTEIGTNDGGVLFSAGDMNFSLLIAGSFIVLILKTVFSSDHKVALRRATEIIRLDFRRDLGNKIQWNDYIN